MVSRRLFLLSAAAGLARSQPHGQVAVISHRGEHLHHPENTLPAFQAAIDAGADFFEADVRTTSDGRLVLMHDGTAARTTKSAGEIASMTFDQVRALDAGARFPDGFSGTPVPLFDEALALARGKIGVYIDCKQVSAEALIAAVEAHKMQEHVVVYGGPTLLGAIHVQRPSWRGMPEAHDPETLRGLIDGLKLKIAAFDAKDFNPPTIAVARDAKVDIFVDRLGGTDNEAGWQDAVDRGVAGIQTDHPAELVLFLRAKGLHR